MSKRKLRSETQALTKKKKPDSVKANSTLSPFEKLPEHLIINIINNLKRKDILNMFFVSKKLNGIISNSTRIMKRFALKIELSLPANKPFKEGIKNNFLCIRKYSCLRLDAFNSKYMKVVTDFLKPYGKHIKNIEITDGHDANRLCMVTKRLIVRILAICDQVETLDISGFSDSVRQQKYNEKMWKDTKPIKLPDLKNLTFPVSGYGLINLFADCKLRSFEMVFDNCESSSKIFKEFLKTQPHVEHLNLSICDDLFEDESLVEMNFKLKSLKLDHDEISKENMEKFIRKQAESLQDLRISSDNIEQSFDMIAICKKVKKLSLYSYYHYNADAISFHSPLESVEELSLSSFKNMRQISEAFPNLKILKLSQCSVQGDILNDLKSVKKLVLHYCDIKHTMTISNLKNLHIEYSKFQLVEKLCFMNNQLEELVVEGYHFSWIDDLLEHEDTKLSYLELEGWEFAKSQNPKIHEIIERKGSNFKTLVISDC